MDKLPPELLHAICKLLDREDVRSIRLVGRKFALIALHYLLSDVSFFLSKDSLERLHEISLNPILCQQVKTLYYQANILQEIKTVSQYREAMELAAHRHEWRPLSPDPDASERERRLYFRNEAKWRRGDTQPVSSRRINSMMNAYNKICNRQQDDIKKHVDQDLLAAAIARFPNLKNITFALRPSCCHRYSTRFMDKFTHLRITPPTCADTAPTVRMLANYLNPLAGTKIKLESLFINHASPDLLRMPKLTKQIMSLKANLATILNCKLIFKLDANKTDMLHEDGGDVSFAVLKDGGLPLLLSHMPKLRDLVVDFDDCPCQTKIPLDRILGDNDFPDLRSLKIAQFSATDDGLLDTLLLRMPLLSKLAISNGTLTGGSWVFVMVQLRKFVCLTEAYFNNILRSEEFHEHWDMRYLNADALGDDMWITLGDDLNFWVCDEIDEDRMSDEDSDEDSLWDSHPLLDEDAYVDPTDIDDDDLPGLISRGSLFSI